MHTMSAGRQSHNSLAKQSFNGSKGFDQDMQKSQGSRHQGAMSPFNQTNASMGLTQANTANLKGKLGALDEMIMNLQHELGYHKKEVQILKQEKETLESVLTMKTQDVRKTLTNELFKVEEEMKRHYAH